MVDIMKQRFYMLATLLIAWTSPIAAGQIEPVTVDVELSRSRVYVGDELSYQIVVRGAKNPPTPVVEFPPSLRSQYHGRTSQSFSTTRVVNGRTRTVTDRRYSFQYTITTVDSGTLVIPAPSITIDGQIYTGEDVQFESLFPIESDTDSMQIFIEREEIYLNETIEIECAWWIGDQTSEFNLNSSSFPESFEIRGLEPRISGQQRVQFTVAGQQMIGVVDDDPNDPRSRSKLVFRMSVTPTETGTFQLGPVRSIFVRHSGTGRNFRAYVESEQIMVTVKSVPTLNQPDGYRGAIGKYRLATSASNSNVNVGDPIELRVRIRGREPMIGVDDGPDIASFPEFSDSFKIATDGWREKLPRQSGQREFSTTIRALHEHVEFIPPVSLPSFNPESGRYEIYQSSPIPLSVAPVEEITLRDAVITGGGSQQLSPQSVERIELTRAMPGLWAHGTADDLLSMNEIRFIEQVSSPLIIGIVASGPSVYTLSFLFVAARRRRNSDSYMLHKAWITSKKMDKQGFHAEAIRFYIASVLGLNSDSITTQDVRNMPIYNQLKSDVISCLELSENASYSDSDENDDIESHQNFHGLVRTLHQQLKASDWSLV
jgi:BatD DUF11 like domain